MPSLDEYAQMSFDEREYAFDILSVISDDCAMINALADYTTRGKGASQRGVAAYELTNSIHGETEEFGNFGVALHKLNVELTTLIDELPELFDGLPEETLRAILSYRHLIDKPHDELNYMNAVTIAHSCFDDALELKAYCDEQLELLASFGDL